MMMMKIIAVVVVVVVDGDADTLLLLRMLHSYLFSFSFRIFATEIYARFSSLETSALELKLSYNMQNGLSYFLPRCILWGAVLAMREMSVRLSVRPLVCLSKA